MNRKIIDHFRINDPVLYTVFQTFKDTHKIDLTPSSDYFNHLCREIIGQQLSGRVADVIFTRFTELFLDGHVDIAQIQRMSDDTLRSIGMSWAKVRTVKDLAQKIGDKTVDFTRMDSASDKEVIQELIKVKGIGPWTAEMFCMFTFGREDIFSYGDLGLENAIKKLYKLKKKPSLRTKKILSNRWKPYRTYACLLLWASLDNRPE